jgi:hypothetical protein
MSSGFTTEAAELCRKGNNRNGSGANHNFSRNSAKPSFCDPDG